MTLLEKARDFVDSEKYLKDFLDLLNDRRYETMHLYECDPPYSIPPSVSDAIWDPVFGVIQIHVNGYDIKILNRLVSRILHSYNDIFSHGSTAHYRLTINDFTSLRTLDEAFSDEFIKNVKHHFLIIDYDVNLSSSFRSTFEQTQLVPFLKTIIQHEKVLLINRSRLRSTADDLPITTFQFYSGIAEDPRWT